MRRIGKTVVVGILWALACVVVVYSIYLTICYMSVVKHENDAREGRFQFYFPLVAQGVESEEKRDCVEALLPKGDYRLIIAAPKGSEACAQTIRTKVWDRRKNVALDVGAIHLPDPEGVGEGHTAYYYSRAFSIASRETLCSFEIIRAPSVCEGKMGVFIATYDPFYKGNIPEDGTTEIPIEME